MDFAKIKTIAIVGLSNSPDKASYRVADYLQKNGYRIIPVNPAVDSVLGERSYPDIGAVPGEIRIDAVDIFRRPEAVKPYVEQAVARGDVQVVWLQEGIINEEAAALARQQGLEVIMDRCMMKEHKKINNIMGE